jgi:hypothetical protein
MKKSIFITLVGILISAFSYSQDVIYLANGNRLEGVQIVEIADKKVYFMERKGDSEFKRAYKRSGISVIFRADGRYLMMAELDEKPEKAQLQLEEYLKAPVRNVSKDIIIKAKPLKVIIGQISYESDEVINYANDDGNAASINKKDVVIVFYKDGSHQLAREPDEVVAYLTKAQKDLSKAESAIFKPAEVAPEPTPEPAPEPVVATPEPTQVPEPAAATPAIEPIVATPKPNVIKPSKGKKGSKPTQAIPTLSEAEYLGYRQKGVDKVKEFEAYLNVIANKNTDPDEKDKAIDEAAKLFIPGSTIEVTSLNKPGVSKYDIKDYLTRLKLLPYASAKLEWANVGYVKELKQEADGNYYGTITGEQTFIGLGDAGQPIYSDVTKKSVKVRLQSYQKQIEGAEQLNWELLLGSIGIEVGK